MRQTSGHVCFPALGGLVVVLNILLLTPLAAASGPDYMWDALGEGLDDTVEALAVFNGEIIGGGRSSDGGSGDWARRRIARWDGGSWNGMRGAWAARCTR